MSLVLESNKNIENLIRKTNYVELYKNSRSIAIPGTKQDGFLSIFRNSLSPGKVVSEVHPAINTLYKRFKFTAGWNPEKK